MCGWKQVAKDLLFLQHIAIYVSFSKKVLMPLGLGISTFPKHWWETINYQIFKQVPNQEKQVSFRVRYYKPFFQFQGGPKNAFIVLSLSLHIKLIQASIFQENHSYSFKVYFPPSIDQAARYSIHERIKTVEAYFATKSVVHIQRQFWRDFSDGNAPTRLTIKPLLDKFRDNGSET